MDKETFCVFRKEIYEQKGRPDMVWDLLSFWTYSRENICLVADPERGYIPEQRQRV
jgi:hypothetical protein